MKNNRKVKIIALALALILCFGIYYVITRTPEVPFYNESLIGIPYIESQKLVQDNMEEQGNKNTKGILSYKVENPDKTTEEVTDYFIKNTDSKLWEVEKLKSNDKNTQQLIYNSKDEKVKSTTQITIIKSEKNIIITITSYYDNSKLIKESQKNNKKAE